MTAARPVPTFALYGLLWAPYLAAMPVLYDAAGGPGRLGTVLLAGGLATLPAMFATGRLLGRFGLRLGRAAVVGFALLAPLPVLAATAGRPAGPGLLLAAVVLFGIGTGACNVAAVGLAAHAESVPGRRAMSRSHAAFSGALLAGSLAGGAAMAAGVSPLVVALAVSAGVLPVAVRPFPTAAAPRTPSAPAPPGRRRLTWPVLMLCAVGALAMVIESGVQQWSAVLLTGELDAPAGLAGTAPGVFAGAMALGRLAGHELTKLLSERALLAGSGVVSAAGLAVLATAGSVPVALAGIAVVGGAISVATPMVYTLVARQVPRSDQARTLGAAVAVAGLGLNVGPASVGRLAGSTDLRTALAALVVVAAAFLVLALAVRTPARTGCPATPGAAVISGSTGRGGAAFVHAATPRHLIGDTPVVADCPVVPLPRTGGHRDWLVTGYREAQQVLRDAALSRAALTDPDHPPGPALRMSITELDPPVHTTVRTLVGGAFSARRVAGLVPVLDRSAAALAGRLARAGSHADLLADFAAPLAFDAQCTVLGVPPRHRPALRELSLSRIARVQPVELAEAEVLLLDGVAALFADPTDPPTGLLRELRDGDLGLDAADRLALAASLFFDGHALSAAQLANSLLWLLLDDARRAGVTASPAALTAFVEEAAREVPAVGFGMTRAVTAPVHVGGVDLHPGDRVVVALGMANRDPARPGGQHMTFGYGTHHCIGAPLARAVIAAGIRAALRLPGLALAVDESDLRWSLNATIRTLAALPVRWRTADRASAAGDPRPGSARRNTTNTAGSGAVAVPTRAGDR